MTDTISVESTLDACPHQIWAALVDPAIRAEWWPGLTFSARAGSALQERWSDDGVDYVATGVVTDVVSRQLVSWTWSDASWTASTAVTITLRETRTGTLVRVSEDGLAQLAQRADVAREHEVGWRWHIEQLRAHIESR